MSEQNDLLVEMRAFMRSQYGENKQITDGNYDQSLAVKCINGTFVGKKTDNVIAYKGIPFVGKQPVGELRWKAPVESYLKQVPGEDWEKTTSLLSQNYFDGPRRVRHPFSKGIRS